MKIHLDYLEGRVEELEASTLKYEQERKRFDRKIQLADEKFKLLKEEKESEGD